MIRGVAKHSMLIGIIILSMWMMYSAMMKLVGFPGMEESFLLWGYPKWFMLVVGGFELVLAVMVFAKPTRVYGLISLIFLMAAALYTHISNGEYDQLSSALFITVLSTACLILIWMMKRMDTTQK